MVAEAADDLRMMTVAECAATLGIGISTWWEWVRLGKAPKGSLLTARCRRWRARDIDALIATKEGL